MPFQLLQCIHLLFLLRRLHRGYHFNRATIPIEAAVSTSFLSASSNDVMLHNFTLGCIWGFSQKIGIRITQNHHLLIFCIKIALRHREKYSLNFSAANTPNWFHWSWLYGSVYPNHFSSYKVQKYIPTLKCVFLIFVGLYCTCESTLATSVSGPFITNTDPAVTQICKPF